MSDVLGVGLLSSSPPAVDVCLVCEEYCSRSAPRVFFDPALLPAFSSTRHPIKFPFCARRFVLRSLGLCWPSLAPGVLYLHPLQPSGQTRTFATLACFRLENNHSTPLLTPKAHSTRWFHTPPGKRLTPVSIDTPHSFSSIIVPPNWDTQTLERLRVMLDLRGSYRLHRRYLHPLTRVPAPPNWSARIHTRMHSSAPANPGTPVPNHQDTFCGSISPPSRVLLFGEVTRHKFTERRDISDVHRFVTVSIPLFGASVNTS